MKIELRCEIKHFSVRYAILSHWNLSHTIQYFGSDFVSGPILSWRLYIPSKLYVSIFLVKSEYRGSALIWIKQVHVW